MGKVRSCLAFSCGCISAAAGLFFVVLYILEAVIRHSGEPDQSLIFWYLPILFIGLICLGIGTFLLVYSRKKR